MTIRNKLNNSNKNQKTKYDRLVSEHDEEKEQFLIQQNGYEQRIQKLRKTIKSLQDSSGDRALQAEQAVEAVENELRGQIQTIKNQLRTCKRTLETTRSELSTSQEQYETVQRQMEKDAIRLQQLDRQLLKEKNDRHNREEQEKNSQNIDQVNNERAVLLENEVTLLKNTISDLEER